MSFCYSGIEAKLESTSVEIFVPATHPMIELANALDWEKMQNIVLSDLKKTTPKLCWWLGRKIIIRLHLAVFILQALLKMTDRGIEDAIKGNVIYQVFSGIRIVENWHCPDHTKIEEFRNRLSPETQRKLISYVVQVAADFGFADPSRMDIDSTVQEANMTYPSDASLLTKLAVIAKKIVDHVKGKFPDVDLKEIKKKAKDYFFMAKNIAIEKRKKAFKILYNTVKNQVMPVIAGCESLSDHIVKNLKSNIRRHVEQVQELARQYLKDVSYFIKNQKMKSGKILSFHIKDVACIIKGKVGKAMEFGRVFQLGRLGGNFVVALASTSVRQEDKSSVIPIIAEHANIFGQGILKSLGADKGYYSKKNVKEAMETVEEVGIQIPGTKKDVAQVLKDRRAGIEPLIGHIKNFGLRKSRAKRDDTSLASGYRAILGFNLHQLMRHQAMRMAQIKGIAH